MAIKTVSLYSTEQLRELLGEFNSEMRSACFKYPVEIPELHKVRASSFLLWLEEREAQELKDGKQPDNRRSEKVSDR